MPDHLPVLHVPENVTIERVRTELQHENDHMAFGAAAAVAAAEAGAPAEDSASVDHQLRVASDSCRRRNVGFGVLPTQNRDKWLQGIVATYSMLTNESLRNGWMLYVQQLPDDTAKPCWPVRRDYNFRHSMMRIRNDDHVNQKHKQIT